jgi:capsular polysaccharide export protein
VAPADGEHAIVLAPALYLWRQPQLSTLFGMRLVPDTVIWGKGAAAACVGWGLKPSGRYAAWRAAHLGLPCVRLEDGFLRSVALGNVEPALSIVVDDSGIYYDAGRPSQLERLVLEPLPEGETARTQSLVAAWRAARVSKYNHLPEHAGAMPARYVLVSDQTFGDASIRHGAASPGSFQRMLQAALSENPDATVMVKIHPDVFARRKRGYFSVAALRSTPRVQVLGEDVHPVSLIEGAEAIYAVTSQIGFEGLLWGKRVRTFGMPFYAGWGLTHDDVPAPDRRRRVPLESLVHAALVKYPRYLDPQTGTRCDPERLIEWMGAQRRRHARPAEARAA